MTPRLLASIGLAAQLLVNFGAIEIAMAATVAEPVQQFELVQELAMSPLIPMSSLHCDGCINVYKPIAHPDTDIAKATCDGVCLVSHSPSLVGMTQAPQKDPVPVAALPTVEKQNLNHEVSAHESSSQRYIAMRSVTETTVLRE